MFYDIYKSPFCEIILVGNEKGLSYLHLNTNKGKDKDFNVSPTWEKKSSFFKEEKQQLNEYFSGRRKVFDIKINPEGTEFQKKVWNALQTISYGDTCSYKDVAIKIGNEKACRAVGMANSKNPIPLIIPCHRVCGSNNKLGGFSSGLEIKEQLLNMEKKYDS